MPRFEFSQPPRDDLDAQQHAVIDFQGIDEQASALIISGVPGSGKTTVANYKAVDATNAEENYLYMAWAKLLRCYLINAFKKMKSDQVIDSFDSSKFVTVLRWYYETLTNNNFLLDKKFIDGQIRTVVKEEQLQDNLYAHPTHYDKIIIDESQDLWPNFINNLSIITNELIICCDDAQDIQGNFYNRPPIEEIISSLNRDEINNTHLTLENNYRNSQPIYDFARSFVSDIINVGIIQDFMRPTGPLPQIFLKNSDEAVLDQIRLIALNNMAVNVGIICDTVSQIDKIHQYLKKNDINSSYYHYRIKDDMLGKMVLEGEIENILICTKKSCKGLEFETVIIPYINHMENPTEFKLKELYVACTRAKDRLVLISGNNQMPLIADMVGDENLYEVI